MAEWDHERLEEKKAEVRNLLIESISTYNIPDVEKTVDKILSESIRFSPPEKERMTLHFITLNSFRSGASSTKPGNIKLGMVDFFEAIGIGAITVMGGSLDKWIYTLGFLLLWKQLWDSATIQINENESKVIWSMWTLGNEDSKLSYSNIEKRLNDTCRQFRLTPLKEGEIRMALSNLESISSIGKIGDDEWRIIEWIRVRYR